MLRHFARRGIPFRHYGAAAASQMTAVAAASATTSSLHLWMQSPSPHLTTKRFQGAYVSRHNISMQVSPQVIMDYCQSHLGLSKNQFKCTSSHVLLKECPFCPKPTGGKLSNLYKLYVESTSGTYFCHRCGASGSWFDFKAHLNSGAVTISSGGGGNSVVQYGSGGASSSWGGGNGGGYPTWPGTSTRGRSKEDPTHQDALGGNPHKEPPLPLPPSRLSGLYSSRLLDPPSETSTNLALDYLVQQRGLTRTTLRKYGVGKADYQFPGDHGYVQAECITFPWIMKESDLQMQEALRGADYVGSVATTKKNSTTTSTGKDEKNGQRVASSALHEATKDKGSPENNSDETNTNDAATVASTDESTVAQEITDPFVTRRIKARAVSEKAWQRLDPPGGGWGLFGLHTVPDDATSIVLTEGEYDAMAVSQATGRPAVSLPNGCRSLPVPVLPLLERFSKIYLWMDNDVPGQEGAQKFAKKLGLNRCYIVSCREAKDANDALLQGLDLDSYIQQASLVPHDRLLSFKDLRDQVLHELLEPDLYKGVPIPSLPGFTKLIKGFRRGELTVLTGATGSGKTTFLGQVSLDLAEQGINVLWGSFEIKNTRLLHKLMIQFSRNPLPDSSDPAAPEILNTLADRFEGLPMHFLRFHGGSDIDEVLDAMEYSVYVHDTEHIILDNMQFMINRSSTNGKNSSFEKFDVQDIAIEKFRKFATQHNVHLTLVVHPRKEDEASPLNISSFYGSAKATQEADTVLILQTDQNRSKTIEVKKNRYDGTLGRSKLFFESKSGRYTEQEGGSGGAPLPAVVPDPSKPHSINFKGPWKRSPPEPEPEGLDNHWDSMLTPGRAADEYSGRA